MRWPSADRLRFLFFALCPLALVGGGVLQWRNHLVAGGGELETSVSREAAIDKARGFLNGLGIDTTGWTEFCGATPNVDLNSYYRWKGGPAVGEVRKLTPATEVRVLFERPAGREQRQRALVTLSLQNQVLGYDIRDVRHNEGGEPQTEEKSRALARSVLDGDEKLRKFLGDARPEMSTIDRTSMGATHKFVWRTPHPVLRELEVSFSVAVRDGRVVTQAIESKIDPDFAARNLQTGQTALQTILFVYLLYLLIASIYSLVRYFQRATQKEVSHSRTLWIAMIIFLIYLGVLLSGYDDTVVQMTMSDASAVPLNFVYALLAAGLVACAILLGITYGSGEGDVREAFPGKLTSLDALLVGKVFSSNVGSSILVGTAFGAWFFLLTGILRAPVAQFTLLDHMNAIRFPFMRHHWISMMLAQPGLVLLTVISGLLQPLAFVTRFFHRWKVQMAVLILCATLSVCGIGFTRPSPWGFTISVVVAVAAVLIPFFRYDLLASMACLMALWTASSMLEMMEQFHQFWTATFVAAGAGAITLAIAYISFRRGRTFTEEQVRPEYAGHIVERQTLQEEVSAAREVQLRLLPENPPDIPGLTIFASCLPARVVGGDFYDFFPLDNGRLGIFIAEGGNRGLASALSIALAKGYLMHRARGCDSPTQVLLRLESTLGAILEAGVARATIAYAVLDTVAGTLSYARTGSYPKIIVARSEWGPSQTEEQAQGDIHQGYAELSEGDTIVLYTDGVARRIAARSSMLQEDWILRLAKEHQSVQKMHQELLDAVGVTAKRTHDLDDDLTAIVIRFSRANVALLEGVA